MTATNSEEWQLSARGAEIYDDILVPAIFAPWVPRVLNAAELYKGYAVLDVACGTGIVADGAAREVGATGSVVGLDINPDMLRVASARRHPSITWTEGDAERMPFPDQHFDCVVCQLGLQYFPNPSAALTEMYRVLRIGGQAAVMLWRGIEHSPGFALLANLIAKYLGPDVGESMRGPFAFDDNEPRLQSLLEHARFAEIEIVVVSDLVHFRSIEEFVQYQLAASPLAAQGDLIAQPWTYKVMTEIMNSFGMQRISEPISFPIEAYLAKGRRR